MPCSSACTLYMYMYMCNITQLFAIPRSMFNTAWYYNAQYCPKREVLHAHANLSMVLCLFQHDAPPC